MPDVGPRPRRQYIDWARGIAVLIMIQAHTLDAWTRASSRSDPAFQWLSMLGGFAAPLFLWLAGLSLALSAERGLERSGSRRQAMNAAVRRGAEIFILAFAFRLQAFIVSPGSWLVTIFRVDILNVMGLSLMATALLWGASRGARSAVLSSATAAIVVAMSTPLVRAAQWVNALPLWMQWHIRPFGDHTTFTLFPWAGFVFAGMAAGVLLARAGRPHHERRVLGGFALAGAALVWFGFWASHQPSLYHSSSFWTSSPTFFAIRSGVMLAALAILFGVNLLGRLPGGAALATFGRNSLFIYWIHVEIVYGYTTWPIRGRLPLWATAVAFVVFTIAMYKTIGLRDRLAEQWRVRGLRKASAGAVPA